MHKFGEFVCKHRKAILIIAILLLIPSILGIKATKINYDILSYLPSDVETVKGQDILSKDFNMGAFSIVLVDNTMSSKDMIKLEDKMKQIEGVEKVIGITDVTGSTIPIDMLPEDVLSEINKEGTTPILVTFRTAISDDETLNAIETLRHLTDNQCKVSGMSATIRDTMEVSNNEMSAYVIIAVILCTIVLMVALDSYLIPIILLGSIGIAILYNMGSNIILGQISYITKAISTVLQLGVTMDFSIFLYHSYQREKAKNSNNQEAMANAISNTLTSVVGSSITTIAGFLALCTMNLALGSDIGIVMAKGVLLGVICVVTILPSLILVLDKWIEKTKHKEIMPAFKHLKNFIMKHYKAAIIVFLVLLIPALYGNSHVKVYYNLYSTLPANLEGMQANKELADKYDMVSTQIALVDKNISKEKVNEMLEKIDKLDGIEWTISYSKLADSSLPEDMLPEDLSSIFQNDKYQMILINSKYETATDEANEQIAEVNNIIRQYDEHAIMAGEGPLMKDLVEIADHDFNSVNIASIAVILIIMVVVFKSASLPVILICVIEFAICLNMSVPCYTGKTIPFVASIVIGTIQLGATVDYAILMTTKYIENRKLGKQKKEAIQIALDNSIKSIVVSALCFFAATCGVGMYSKLEMISSICNLISRGAIISMIVVITMLPAFLMVFDKLICKTTKGMKNCK